MRTIDADKGQLANPEKAFPMDYPAVLINLDTVGWLDLPNKVQEGKLQVGITVVVLPTSHPHSGSPTIDDFIDEMQIINDVYGVLQGFLGLKRIKTSRQKRWDTLQAYTHIFTNKLTDKTAQRKFTKIEANLQATGSLK